MKAKQLNENSWMLSKYSGENCGIVLCVEGKFRLLKSDYDFYDSIEDLIEKEMPGNKFQGFEQREQVEEIKEDIDGFEIKHDNAINVRKKIVDRNEITIYNNGERSDIDYAAGYFGVAHKAGMNRTFCPKLSTLENSEFIGPFKTEFDAKFHINNWLGK